MTDDRKMVPLKELLDMGLIFEINRRILHPLGMALSIEIEEDADDEGKFGGVWDSRDDPEGFEFGDEIFVEGLKKYEEYMKSEGDQKLAARVAALGYVIQGEPVEEPDK